MVSTATPYLALAARSPAGGQSLKRPKRTDFPQIGLVRNMGISVFPPTSSLLSEQDDASSIGTWQCGFSLAGTGLFGIA